MKYTFVKSFSEFSQMINENNSFQNLKNPKTFEEMRSFGTFRWLPCREYNIDMYQEKISQGCYYIYIDKRNHPIFLLDICSKHIVDFDNKEYTDNLYYEYISNYPDVLNYITKL